MEEGANEVYGIAKTSGDPTRMNGISWWVRSFEGSMVAPVEGAKVGENERRS